MIRSPLLRWSYLLLVAANLVASAAPSAEGADPYQERVAPFLQKYCVRCHSDTKPKGELNLARVKDAGQVVADFRRWENLIGFIRGGEMPPEDEPQPEISERQAVTEALQAILLEEAKRHAGDPGVILPRRLSNTEYDLSIRDLTGVDIRPTRDFPVDPAAGEGFDNTGEALGVSPNLLKKYLAAAQEVSDHLVLKTSGISFAPFPVTSYNEQKKLTEGAIIEFYQRHAVKLGDYLEAAWRYRHRGEAERDADVATWAKRRKLSGKYLALVTGTLNEASSGSGYLKQLGELWNKVPAPTDGATKPHELAELQRLIEFAQQQLCYRDENLIQSNAGNWPIAHLAFRTKVTQRRDQVDPSHFKSKRLVKFGRLPSAKDKPDGVTLYLRIDRAFDDGTGGTVILRRPILSKESNPPRNEEEAKRHEVIALRSILEQDNPGAAKRLRFGEHPDDLELDVDSLMVQAPTTIEIPLSAETLRQHEGKHLLVECELLPQQHERSVYLHYSIGKPPAEPPSGNAELLIHADSEIAKQMAESCAAFCNAFPNRFFYVDGERGLAAGFHLVDGFFRDDAPLVKKVLDEQELQELNQLWRELEFVTNSTEVLLRGFVWFERAERHVLHDARFDFLRDEDPKLVEEELLGKFERVYLGKMGVKLIGDTLEPEKPSDQYDLIHGFFERIRTGLALRREQLQVAERKALAELSVLTERAFKRPLRPEETVSFERLYREMRARGQSVESSLRGVLTAVLMSPHFFLRHHETPAGPGVHPLSGEALASRLSYFLWSSLPDDTLLAAVQNGKLQNEAELVAQTRRMLADPKIDAFSREFFGQWLRYRDYLSKDAINAASFPGYDDALREAMFEEPVRLATYLIQEDKPITELLHSDITFVNGALAKHYGGEILAQYNKQSTDRAEWRRVDGLRQLGRGGLLGMGVVLTKTSKAERTSPVKRGFWTVHHLLGQHFPPPPADVPELPPGEKQATATIRQLIKQHTENTKCAMCHVHFDSLGMALEGFDPIGRARTKDLAGRPIDDSVTFPDGTTARGIPGLIDFIEQHRRQDFVRTFCRKFLGYALGRSVVLSDQPLLNEMEAALEKNEYRFSVMFEMVVRSPQFRQQRGSEFVAK
jgi:hypothetical protein